MQAMVMKSRLGIPFLSSWYLAIVFLMVDSQKCGSSLHSINGFKLDEHAYQVSEVTGFGECKIKCAQDPLWQSFILRLSTLRCMLFQVNHLNAKLIPADSDWEFMPDLSHPCYDVKCGNGGSCVLGGTNGASCVYSSSCSSLHQKKPYLRNGYYWLNVSGTVSETYCNLETRGVFRLDVHGSTTYTVYFKIPSGSNQFSSSCKGRSCPRIITSHSYPFVWESSPCTGTTKGYHLYTDCYYMFDNHDGYECGSRWTSSKFYTERGLYGFCSSTGIYKARSGYMYVK